MFNAQCSMTVLPCCYLAPVSHYSALFRAKEGVQLDVNDRYRKQTFRNRCMIDSPQGALALSIPVEKPAPHALMRDIRISDHGNWRHLHWNALQSSYRQSPFFEYYADDFAPFYEKKWEFLADFNEDLLRLICSLIDIDTPISRTTAYAGEQSVFSPIEKPYYQVFARKHGFLQDLSIVDLLFNMGPEGMLWL
jgi:hypothetical protein